MADRLTTEQIENIFRKPMNPDDAVVAWKSIVEDMSKRIDEQDKILLLVAQRLGELMKGGKAQAAAPAQAPPTPAAPVEDDAPPMAMPMAQKIKVNGVEMPTATSNAKPAT